MAHVLVWLAQRLTSLTHWLLSWVGRTIWLCLFVCVGLGSALASTPTDPFWPIVARIGLAFAIAFGVTFLPALIWQAIWYSLFGRELIGAGLWLEMSSEPTPPGSWNVYQVGLREASGLRHSEAHDDLETLNEVTAWVRRVEVAEKRSDFSSAHLTPIGRGPSIQ